MTLPIKIIMSVVKLSTYIITSFAARAAGLDVILVIMSVSTFNTDVMLLLLKCISDEIQHALF